MPQDDLVIGALKAQYFALALTENYPSTPAITAKLDHLEAAIRELQHKPAVNPS